MIAQSYNHASLKAALKELGIDFYDGHKEFVMQCIFSDCTGHKKPLYLNCSDRFTFHCFRCGRSGLFDTFVGVVTGWTPIRVGMFCRKFAAFDDPDDVVDRKYAVKDVTEEMLDAYNYRHPYCYDRGLNEATLRRYRIGFDSSDFTITLPWFDRVGRLVCIKKRTVPPAAKAYRFIASGSFSHVLFGLHLIRPQSIVWCVEAEFDAMWIDQTSHLYSLKQGAVALGGKQLYTRAMEELLIKSPSLIVLATDNDDDGRQAMGNIKTMLQGKVPIYEFVYPAGAKDPNEVAQQHIVNESLKAQSCLSSQVDKLNSRYERWQEENKCVL